MKLDSRMLRAAPLLVAACCLAANARSLAAQGCEPIRFTSPLDLGGQGQAYQPLHKGQDQSYRLLYKWRLTLAYRRLHSDEFFVGTSQKPSAAGGGESPVFDIHTVVADAAYSINSRYRLRLSVPFSSGKFSRVWPDLAHHAQTASGIGDVSVMGDAWLLRPETHQNGNVGIGLGVKAPTGSHSVGSQTYSAFGPADFPADQPIQPGDGGWALLLEGQTFRRVTERSYVYGFASYMVSPKAQTDARLTPSSNVHWAVPDVYSARLGAAFSLLPEQGLSVSLGARMDGIPLRDLVGGGDDSTVKRVSRVIFADPGLSLNRGRSSFTLSVPVRISVNRMKSLLEQRTNGLNGGGFAKYLVFTSFSYRL